VSNHDLRPESTLCPVEPLVREPLTAGTALTLAAKFKALSDPVRLRLLSSVASHAGGAACVCDISAGVDVSQPTISHHLKVLRDAGLLTSERRASWVYYSVVPEELMTLSSLLSVSAETAPTAGAPA
jgi:ArsR family transcriptional regulator